MENKSNEFETTKPFWRMWWFWLLLALVVLQLPLFGEEADIPDEMDQTFFYQSRDSFEDLMYGWIDRKMPETLTPEWVQYHYEQIQLANHEFSEDEVIIIESLHIMLEELTALVDAYSRGESIEHYRFIDAAIEVRDQLKLPDQFNLGND